MGGLGLGGSSASRTDKRASHRVGVSRELGSVECPFNPIASTHIVCILGGMSRASVVKPIAVLSVLLVAGAAAGDVLSVGAAADNTLYESTTGGNSNGNGTAMFAGRNSGTVGSIRRAVLRFDLSGIPAGSVVTDVSLQLYDSAANVDNAVVSMHVLANSWGEGRSAATGGQGSGAPAQGGDATWLHRFSTGTLWNTPGGDFAVLPSAQTTVGGAGFYNWSGSGLVSDVQQFLLNPSLNFGWLLRGDESVASSAKRFGTREEPIVEQRPVLTVTFQVPLPTGAAAFLFFGGLLASRRRRSA